MVTSKSMWQKLNMHSSTEVELVAVDHCLPQVLWTQLFLMSQGYSTGETIIWQDNKVLCCWPKMETGQVLNKLVN